MQMQTSATDNTDTAQSASEADSGQTMQSGQTPSTSEQPNPVNLTGRAVFVVETTEQGVMVRSAFLTEDKQLLDMPAIFPELSYALNVVDDLKRQITEQFAQAAQIGARVIAQQARVQQAALASEKAPSTDSAASDRGPGTSVSPL